jgi:hypothetical protein
MIHRSVSLPPRILKAKAIRKTSTLRPIKVNVITGYLRAR